MERISPWLSPPCGKPITAGDAKALIFHVPGGAENLVSKTTGFRTEEGILLKLPGRDGKGPSFQLFRLSLPVRFVEQFGVVSQRDGYLRMIGA